MAKAASSADDPRASIFPALTTTFTPPPECTSWYIDECTETNCYVKAFPTGTGICGSHGSDSKTSYACYPKLTQSTQEFANGQEIFTLEVVTYSPGLYCPLGMSTATSVPLLDGVFCCPSGMRFQGGLEGGTCARTQTEGTFIVSGDCTPTTIPKPTGTLTTTISIYAMPVFLGGQKLLGSSSPSTTRTIFFTTSSPTPTETSLSPGSDDGNNRGPSIGLKVGLGVGIPLGVILLLALCGFWCIKRYRKKQSWKMQWYEKHTLGSGPPSEVVEVEKPELAGSTFQSPYIKAELDPSVMRAELEAPPLENGAGIFVHKPELQGTGTLPGRAIPGVYVKGKGELEAITPRRSSAPVYHFECFKPGMGRR